MIYSSFMAYLIKLSISLSLIYLFYLLFLRRLTFHTWNRWYLLIYPAAAFLLPLIDISGWLPQQTAAQPALIRYVPVLDGLEKAGLPAVPATTGINHTLLLTAVLITGSVLMLLRSGWQYLSLLQLRSTAQLIMDNGIKVYQVNKPIVPFSFGRSVYINQALHEQNELKEIIRHEFVHVKQRHSIDMIYGELLCILNWYNPFAWLIRRAIRQNLEFIADEAVLLSGLDRKQYQYILLKVTGMPGFSIATNFNFSSLKKRIAMMNKNRSAKIHLARFALVLPLAAIVLLAFRSLREEKTTALVTGNNFEATATGVYNDTVPAPRKAPVAEATGVSFPGWQEIREMKKTEAGILHVTRKDGKKEKYDLNDKKQAAAFEKKYLPGHGRAAEIISDEAFAPVASSAVVTGDVTVDAPVALNSGVSATGAGTATALATAAQHGQVIAQSTDTLVITGSYTRSPVKNAVKEFNVQSFAGYVEPVVEKQELIGLITSGLSREDLKQIQADMAEKGIKFQIENLRYDQGQIVFLKGIISHQDEHNYFRVTDFNVLKIYKNTVKGKDWLYFKINKGSLNVSDHQ